MNGSVEADVQVIPSELVYELLLLMAQNSEPLAARPKNPSDGNPACAAHVVPLDESAVDVYELAMAQKTEPFQATASHVSVAGSVVSVHVIPSVETAPFVPLRSTTT